MGAVCLAEPERAAVGGDAGVENAAVGSPAGLGGTVPGGGGEGELADLGAVGSAGVDVRDDVVEVEQDEGVGVEDEAFPAG
jgi:hypothetical protein